MLYNTLWNPLKIKRTSSSRVDTNLEARDIIDDRRYMHKGICNALFMAEMLCNTQRKEIVSAVSKTHKLSKGNECTSVRLD